MTIRISVIMPVRDAEAYVGAAISSILGQTLDDLELIVVDDGCTDRTGEALALCARADRRVRLVLATRTPAEFGMPDLAPVIQIGASSRATLGLVAARPSSTRSRPGPGAG